MTNTLKLPFIAGLLMAGVSFAANPVAHPDTFTTFVNHRIVCDVTDNDVGDGTFFLTGIDGHVAQPSHGTVGISSDATSNLYYFPANQMYGHLALVYQPAGGFSGTDNFTYTIRDAAGQTSTASVLVNVINSRPVPKAPDTVALAGKKLNVLFIGDEEVSYLNLPGGVAAEFEKKYGYFGTGFRSFEKYGISGREWYEGGNGVDRDITNRYMEINTIGFNQVNTHSVPEVAIPTTESPSGILIYATSVGAAVSVDFYGTSVSVFYNAANGFGSFKLVVDGTDYQTVNSGQNPLPNIETRKTTVSGLTAGWHTLQVVTTSSGKVELLGLDARLYSGTGPVAVCNVWGGPYNFSLDPVLVQDTVFSSALKLVNPDIVFLVFGLHDANMQSLGYMSMLSNANDVARRIRAACPNAKIVMSPTSPNIESSTGATDMRQQSYLREWPAAAAGMGANYWDMFHEMGGNVSPFAHTYRSVNYACKVHLISPEGGRIIAKKIVPYLDTLSADAVVPEVLTALPDRTPPPPVWPAIGNPAFWLAADAAMKIDANNGIAEWTSLEQWWAYPVGARQPNKDRRPKLVNNGLHGRPTVRFDGIQQCVIAYPFTQSHAIGSGGMAVIKADRMGDPLVSDFSTLYAARVSTTAIDTGFRLIEFTNGGNYQEIGHLQYVPQVGSGVAQPNEETFFKGEIAELVLWDDWKGTAQRTTARNYLLDKWFTGPVGVTGHGTGAIHKNSTAQTVKLFSLSGKFIGTSIIGRTMSNRYCRGVYVAISNNNSTRQQKKLIVVP